MDLDVVIARLQNLPGFTVSRVNEKGTIDVAYQVDMGIVIQELLSNFDIEDQAQLIPAQIVNWGRIAAQVKRVWEVTERQYRVWRDSLWVDLATPLEGKKPTDKLIDATVRRHPGYSQCYAAMEEAEEIYNSCTAILDGWRAKKDIYKTGLIRRLENTAA